MLGLHLRVGGHYTKLTKYTGLKDQYIDVMVDIRTSVETDKDNCGLYISNLFTKNDVMLGTTLWDLARQVEEIYLHQMSIKV